MLAKVPQVPMTQTVLFIVAHPDINVSRANKVMASVAQGIDGVTVHDIYETYPDLFVNGAAERHLLEKADALVLQFPFFWYGAPGLLKEWIDRTLISGWAYGHTGHVLRGKPFFISVSTGSARTAYREGGIHGHPIEDYFLPFEQIARFCGMIWQPPMVFYRARHADDSRLGEHAEVMGARLSALTSGAVI